MTSEAFADDALAAVRVLRALPVVGFDPSTALRQVKCPVFAGFGGRDLQGPEAVNRMRLETALKAAGNPQVTVRVYPEANHLFMPAVTGQLAE